jgi:subtilisin family serine protease
MFPGKRARVWLAVAAGISLACSGGAAAQTIGPIGPIGGVGVGPIGPVGLPAGVGSGVPQLPSATAGVGRTLDGVQNGLLPSIGATVDNAGRPIDQRFLDLSSAGQKVVRGEVLIIEPTAADLATAQSLKFRVGETETLGALQMQAVALHVPSGMRAVEALAILQAADPSGNFDLNHIYDPSGARVGSRTVSVQRQTFTAPQGLVIGMIDAGIDKNHPALAHTEIIAGNVTGTESAPATAHGTAVASLLVGNDANFYGQLPGATLYAADVFGGLATGGSALDIARALDWLAQNHVAVVNASLSGPPNRLLAEAVKAFVAHGHVLVAAAGNEGPAAPPSYPAAYSGVVGVTSVDANHRLQVDANRGNVAFAALGVSVRAATLKKGYDFFTGTSFAAPVVAARFALMVRAPDPQAVRDASSRLAKAALRLGEQAAYGYGFVSPVQLTASQ